MIAELTYKGKVLPVSVGYYALKRFKQDTGKEFTAIQDDDLEDLEVLFWHSLEAGYKHQGKDNPHKREDIELIFDEVMMEFIERIPDFFQSSPEKIKGTPTPPAKKQRKK